jgi:amino acid adenylation domain-containing protein
MGSVVDGQAGSPHSDQPAGQGPRSQVPSAEFDLPGLGAHEWVSVLGSLMSIHHGGEPAAVDIELGRHRERLVVDVDRTRQPRYQPRRPRAERPPGEPAALVLRGEVSNRACPVILQVQQAKAVLWLDAETYSPAIRDRLALHLNLLVAAATPLASVSLPAVTAPAPQPAVPGSLDARAEPDWGRCVIGRLLHVTQQSPASVALVAEGGSLTYQELADWVGGVAEELRQTVPRAVHVAILAEHGIEPVVAMLACLASRTAYVPLDPRMPDGRLRRIVQQCRPAMIVHGPGLGDRARSLAPEVARVELARRAGELVAPPASTDDARTAYVLYTSGSTGVPKGVVQTVPGIMQHARNYRDSVGLVAGETALLLASFAVDAAVMDIYGGLLTGATVHVVDPLQPAEALHELIEARPPGVLHGTPTLLRHLLDEVSAPWTEMAGVRVVAFGGERVSASDGDRVRRALPGAFIVNGLGPSECTVALQHVSSPEDSFDRADLPIGVAVPGVRAQLVDPHGRPAPIVGELVLSSPGVAAGYHTVDERSSGRFTTEADGRRSFRTGDRVWLGPDGNLVFVGRVDRQLKVRGQRVDPCEIESVLREHPAVEQVAVCVDKAGELTALVASAPTSRLEVKELRRFAARYLSPVAVPSRVVLTEDAPVGPTGKLDLQALADRNQAVEEQRSKVANATGHQPPTHEAPEASRAPLTFGQLSVLRSLRGHEQTASANVSRLIDLDEPVGLDRVTTALRRLTSRHGSLRTVFEFSARNEPVQVIDPTGQPSLRIVELSQDTSAARSAVVATIEAEAYDIESESPWRVAVLTSGGAAVALALSLHHIVSDAWAAGILERELRQLIEDPDRELGIPLTPGALALRQRGSQWDEHRVIFEDHWAPMFGDPRRFPSAGPAEAGPRVVATMTLTHSGSDVERLAREIQVFPSAILTTVAMLSWPALSERIERSVLSATLMSAGRIDEDLQQLVASQNQVVPIALDRLDSEPFSHVSRRAQDAIAGAAMAGMYDVDAVCARAGAKDLGDLLDHWVNIVNQTGDQTSTRRPPPAHTCDFTAVEAPYKAWPYFYYRVRVGRSLKVELAVPPHLASPGDLRRVLQGWDRALTMIERDSQTTVADVAALFRPEVAR